MESTKHFVLVHGACHGAWCWYKLVTLLKTAGHHVTALDLGGSGVDRKPLEEITSISDYLQPLMEFMASLPHKEKVILIGHSYGGLSISLAMERFPEKVSEAVFLAAYMPHYKSPPGILIQEYFKGIQVESVMDCQFTFNQGMEKAPTSVLFGPEFMKDKAYRHCHPENLELAKLLVRPSGLFLDDWSKENMLTEEKYGSVNRVFILTEEDEVMKGEFQMWMIDNYPTREVRLIAKSGHMVMLSKPNELSLILQELADKYS